MDGRHRGPGRVGQGHTRCQEASAARFKWLFLFGIIFNDPWVTIWRIF